jgi:hypothetical protein
VLSLQRPQLALQKSWQVVLLTLLLGLLCAGLISPTDAATPCVGPRCPGDTVLFTEEEGLDLPTLKQTGFPVLDSRSAGTCPAGITAITPGVGPTCAVGGLSGAFYVVTQPNASLPNAQLLGAGILMRGSHAARPAASIAGRRYFYTDAPLGAAYDTGSTWVEDQLDWAQVTNKTAAPHASTHNPGQSDDISATYATKVYADSISQGIKQVASVQAATTSVLPSNTYSNGTAGVGATITGTANGALAAQDTVTLTIGQSLLVKNETAGLRNGIYTVTTVGDGSNPFILTRRADADQNAEVTTGLFTFIDGGSDNVGEGWRLITAAPITVGTTTLTFTQFSGGGTILGGAGLLKTGNVLDIIAGSCITVGADNVGITPACITDTQILSLNADKLTAGLVPRARLQPPTTTALGTLFSKECPANTPYASGVDTNGVIQCIADVTGSGGLPPSVTLSNLVGTSVSAPGLIPPNSFVWGIRAQVTQDITGPSSFQVGTIDDPGRWGSAVSGTVGTMTDFEHFEVGAPQIYRTATDVVITSNTTDFTAGAVKLYAYYTTLNTLAIAATGGGVIAEVADTVESLDGVATTVAVVNGARLQFASGDQSVQVELSQLAPEPLQVIGVDLRVTAPTQPTFQQLFDASGGIITGLTAANPFCLSGIDPDGARLCMYESGGDFFREVTLADGTPASHIFQLRPGNRFAIGTETSPDTMRLTEAEPDVIDLRERSTDPTAPAGRGKLYIKNDGVYARTETGVVGPLGAGGSSSVPPIRPYSAIPVTAGSVFGCLIDGDEMLCIADESTLTADATWRLGFEMPPVLATECEYRLQVDVKANASSGVARLNPKWNTWAPGVTRTSLTLNAETVTPDSVSGAAGSGATVTFGAGDANQLVRLTWTLNASTVTAGQRIAMDLVAENTSYTLATTLGTLPSIICD